MNLIPASLRRMFSKAFSLAEQEASALRTLHEESKAAVRHMVEADPGLRGVLEKAHAYAVFPAVGKATAVIGGAFGKGEVFQGDQLVGYAGVVQLTLGVQVGGHTFSQIVALENKQAFERFKAGRTKFSASASAVLVKSCAAASSNYDTGALVFVSSEGGMMLEAAIGAQKFIFKPAALGRAKASPPAGKAKGRRSAPARRSEPTGTSRKRRPGSEAENKTGSARSKAARPAKKRPARTARSGGP